MKLLRRGRRAVPRLVPELGDFELGRMLGRASGVIRPTEQDFVVAAVEHLLRESAEDWDRCTHRVRVLARTGNHRLFEAWCSQRAEDPYALVLNAWSTLELALVNGDLTILRHLERTCRRSAELMPGHPTPWVALLAVQRRLQRSPHEVMQVLREITRRDPWHREAYRQMLCYLSPEECGSVASLLDFVDEAQEDLPPDAPAIGLHLAALTDVYHRTVLKSNIGWITSRHYWAAPPAKRVLDQAAAHWTRPGFLSHAAALADLNLLAYALVEAGRMQEAADAFRAIDGTVTTWPWGVRGDPVHMFSHWHDRLL
ncbi:hypothetical protein [Streptomyces sp. NPDC002573]|uniref:hypothetical protein n=1 Tax=Streptomyces sp. NPDC002573 TaxID=3364651 RepID=UPI0036A29658